MNNIEAITNTVETLSGNVQEIIKQAASLLGKTALHLYMVLVKQQLIIGIQNVVLAVAFTVGAIIAYRFTKRLSANKNIHDLDELFIYVFMAAIIITLALRTVEHLNIGIAYLGNPEYKAIIEAAELVKSLKN